MKAIGYKISFYANGKLQTLSAFGDDALECIIALEMILADAGKTSVVEVIFDDKD